MAAKIKKSQKKHFTSGHVALKVVGWILIVAILSFGALIGWGLFNGDDATKNTSKQQGASTTNADNGSTKNDTESEEETKTTAGNDAKEKTDELEKQQATETEKADSGLKKADVVLYEPYWAEGKLIISSVVTNIHENEGNNCYYILSSGASTTTIVQKVMPNAKNTVCKALEIEKGSLAPGQWSVRLEYKSNYAEGVSETQTFTME